MLIPAQLTIQGCDDSTSLTLQLTQPEFDPLCRISALSLSASTHRCQPHLICQKASP